MEAAQPELVYVASLWLMQTDLVQAASLFSCSASAITIFARSGGTLYSSYGLSNDQSNDTLGSAEKVDVPKGTGCCSWVLVQIYRRTLLIDDCTTDIR